MLKFNSYYFLICFFALVSSFTSHADTIILKDATSIEVYNVEEAGKWILYTTDSNPDSKLLRLPIDKVFAIKTNEGELRMVGDNSSKREVENSNSESASLSATKEPKLIPVSPSSDNASHVMSYNTPVLRLKKAKKESDKAKICSNFLSIWGVTESSVLSDENITVYFAITLPKGPARKIIPQYKTIIKNKTDKPIYIDLANSFKYYPNGIAKPYFTNSVYSEGSSSSKGMSVNLGAVAGALGIGGTIGTLANGVGIGVGNTTSSSVTTMEERFITIPPKGLISLPPMKYSDGSNIREDYETLYIRTYPIGGALTSDGEMRRYDANKGFVHSLEEEGGIDDASITKETIGAPLGWIKEFDENTTPKKLSRSITYSTTPSFETYTCLEYSLYVRGVMGSNPMRDVPTDYDKRYLECDDESHLLIGIGMVKNK